MSNTKLKLSKTLCNLMVASSFQEITISEICAYSGVSRKSFYNNFSSKEDLLKYMIQEYVSLFLDIINKEPDLDIYSLCIHFFAFWENKAHENFYKSLIRDRMFFDFIDEFAKSFTYVDQIMGCTRRGAEDQAYMKYSTVFYANGIYAMLKSWMDGGCRESKEELAHIYLGISQSYYIEQ